MISIKDKRRWGDILKLKADDVKKRYGVYGHYYNFEFQYESYPCRSMLDMVDHDDTPLIPTELVDRRPSALVVMMNPGSSRPVQDTYRPVTVNSVSDIPVTRELVPAVPDTTQYQVLKIAMAMNWRHVRILNISDLRESKSTLFFEKDLALRNHEDGDFHTLWSDNRTQERQALLGNNDIPILVGWRQSSCVLPLAKLCWSQISDRNPIGVRSSYTDPVFFHPSPMLQEKKNEWLIDVLNQLHDEEEK